MRPTLIFLPGWGQSTHIWYQQNVYFSENWPVRFVCLPGHGDVPDAPADRWVTELCKVLPDSPCIFIGWSLGGMLAIQLAHLYPERIAGLVLVSSTPCFCTKTDWPYGCSDGQFHAFEQTLENNSSNLLGQFIALMLHGDALPRSRFNAIVKQAIDRKHPPLPTALRAGLNLLDTLDLRDQLMDLPVPVLVMHGEYDHVVPVDAGRHLANHIPDASLHIMQCGHAPHLTQAKIFNEHLEQWCGSIYE